MSLFHAVAWVDHHAAQVFQFDASQVLAQQVREHARYTRQHGSSVRSEHEFFGEVCDAMKGVAQVLVTGSHTAQANWYATVQHGMLPDQYRFSPQEQDGYLAFLGRISPEKRPDRAIEIAKAAGVPLKIAAKVDAADRVYFDTCIRPMLDHPLIEFVGEIGDAQKSAFLGGARALLFPIDWPEPFGLVMIEAMACGTPVIAWRCGSVPEVVQHGISGLIVDDIAGAVKAVHGITGLSRARVRRAFDERFTAQAMAKRYGRLYWQLVHARRLRESEVA